MRKNEPRFQPDYSAFDIRDPETGRLRCRSCGKFPEGRRRHYCSEECYARFYRALSWGSTRRRIWERDGRKCQGCGDPVRLHDSSMVRIDGKLVHVYGWKLSEIHHIVPVVDLRIKAYFAVRQIQNGYKFRKAFIKVFMLLYYDWNNLITYCEECHVKEHVRMNEEARIKQNADLKLSNDLVAFIEFNNWREKQRSISDYIGNT